MKCNTSTRTVERRIRILKAIIQRELAGQPDASRGKTARQPDAPREKTAKQLEAPTEKRTAALPISNMSEREFYAILRKVLSPTSRFSHYPSIRVKNKKSRNKREKTPQSQHVSFALGPPPRGTHSYASDLARRLRERDFTVFFSEDEAAPGEQRAKSLLQYAIVG